LTRKIGFLLNPVAGMGGAVGLKGTDGLYQEAVRRGACPVAPRRAEVFLRRIRDLDLTILTCSGGMGERSLQEAGIRSYKIVYHAPSVTTAEDTRMACMKMIEAGVSLIVFCGGDGTARDIAGVVHREIPVLGVPAGVKMFSSVFALNPAAAAEVVGGLDRVTYSEGEVMDVDEEAYRSGHLGSQVFGIVRVPSLPLRVQESKWVCTAPDEATALDEIARFITMIMRPDTLYLLGAGSTVDAIKRRLGHSGTLLGVDAVLGGEMVGRDLEESRILDLLATNPRAKIILSPIGAQGFVLGRGNQQFSPAVVRTVGPQNLIVVASPQKLAQTPVLHIDTGDEELDKVFGESLLVISSYCMGQRVTLRI
jgi:predicted polyphosphate/ATP-dependent NAD kinase